MQISEYTQGTDENTIGMMLLKEGTISRSQLSTAMMLRESARKSGETLVELGVISPTEFAVALEFMMAEILVGLGYAEEQRVFGSMRIQSAMEIQTFSDTEFCIDEDLLDF